ncbi:GNAT family N-acetyltransferase [Dyella subtropica]|uniref:GNAT family N-acetyltransferase n=1 Tax=Dyella subtropica TaxID=2992127 RepID=UPI002255AF81|nr:GNAT family N-acetyltransferase [Dyella subtropica]
MTTDITVRRAYGADVDRLVPLCAEHAAYERISHAGDQRIDALIHALDSSPAHLHAWIAEAGDSAVGYVTATLDFSTLDRAVFLHMDCLYVREGWRGRAIGWRLWREVYDFARAHGCRNMQWQTPQWNEDAARFYRRLGASELSKRRFTLVVT